MNAVPAWTDRTAAAEPLVRMVPIEQIDVPDTDMRRVPVSPRRQLALVASVRRRGLIQAVGLRPKANRYELVFGRRRFAACQALGLAALPADIRAWSDEEIRAVQAAENLVREPPHPIDTWCTVAELVQAGYTIEEAAEECGLEQAETRRMERLGQVHPDLLKLMEVEMPSDHQLRIIALAPKKTQAAAIKDKVRFTRPGGGAGVRWHDIAQRCRVQRISRQQAIFDADAHPELWEEDFFAAPDAYDRFTTSNLARFRELQQDALEARVQQRRAAKERVQLAELAQDMPQLPKGWKLVASPASRKPHRTECIFTAMRADGAIAEVLAVDVAAQKAADRKVAERQKARAAESGNDAAPVGSAGDAGDDDAPAESTPRVSRAAQDFIAAAKTKALHAALANLAPERMLNVLLLALAADNVQIRARLEPEEWSFHNIVGRRLLAPGGQLLALSQADLCAAAAGLLMRLLTVGGSADRFIASGAAAEWIGAAIDAAAELPRFDTAEYLAHVPLAELKPLAKGIGWRTTGTAAQLREALVGKLPDWRPAGAVFGAPAPRED